MADRLGRDFEYCVSRLEDSFKRRYEESEALEDKSRLLLTIAELENVMKTAGLISMPCVESGSPEDLSQISTKDIIEQTSVLNSQISTAISNVKKIGDVVQNSSQSR